MTSNRFIIRMRKNIDAVTENPGDIVVAGHASAECEQHVDDHWNDEQWKYAQHAFLPKRSPKRFVSYRIVKGARPPGASGCGHPHLSGGPRGCFCRALAKDQVKIASVDE